MDQLNHNEMEKSGLEKAGMEQIQKEELVRRAKRKRMLRILLCAAGIVVLAVALVLLLNRCRDSQKKAKPVIYLYPEQTTRVSVKLRYGGKLLTTYPAYREGWEVTAAPDGVLTDAEGQTYNYLYWEGEDQDDYDLSSGFCVRGEDSAAFLTDALARLGLNRREANEFIVYWLPELERSPYNLISFQTDRYTDSVGLEISPEPDTVIRVFLVFRPLKKPVEIPAQDLTAPARTGFTVVEWGGCRID